METDLVFEGKTYTVSMDKTEGAITIRIGDRSFEGEIRRIASDIFSIKIGAKHETVFTARTEERVWVHAGGHLFEMEEAGARGQSFVAGGGFLDGGAVSSPMPGRVVKIPVEEGQVIERNQVLVIVEAMKMENPLRSSVDGTVRKIHYAEGDLVDAGTPIVDVEPEGD